MTTIAYRDGFIATDTCASWNGVVMSCPSKLVRGGGYVFALSGDVALRPIFKQWLDAGANTNERPVISYAGSEKPSARIIVAWIGEQPRIAIYDEDFLVCDHPLDSYCAIGSGEKLAFGAMAHGACAIDAVRAAAKHDPHTATPVDWIDITTAASGRVIL